jgi:phospholipase C
MSEHERGGKAFHDNFERLKAERLAREAHAIPVANPSRMKRRTAKK